MTATDNARCGGLPVVVVLIVGGLSYVPALTLAPVLEYSTLR